MGTRGTADPFQARTPETKLDEEIPRRYRSIMIPQMMGRFRIRRRDAGDSATDARAAAEKELHRRLDAVSKQIAENSVEIMHGQAESEKLLIAAFRESVREITEQAEAAEEKRKLARQAEERTRNLIRQATEQNQVAAPPPPKPLPAWVPR